MKSEFENSIKRSASYEKLVYRHGERLFIFDDGKYKIAAVQLAWEIFKEKQTDVDELQCEVKRINLWYSNVKLQLENKEIDSAIDAKKIDELQVENKILNQAASTHLKNQMHFKKLYDALVEQLYPYAIDLEDPVDGDVNTPKEYVDGYNRAHECVHYNLLEMMESDVEYIRAQCGMLGGGGGSDESN